MLFNEFTLNRFECGDDDLDTNEILDTYINYFITTKNQTNILENFNVDFLNDTNVQTIANIINNEIDLYKLYTFKNSFEFNKDFNIAYKVNVKQCISLLCMVSNNQSILEKLYHLSSLINDDVLSSNMVKHLLLNINTGRTILKNINVDENNVILFAFRKLDTYLYKRIYNFKSIKNYNRFFYSRNYILNDLHNDIKVSNNFYDDDDYDDISYESFDEYLLNYGVKVLCKNCMNIKRHIIKINPYYFYNMKGWDCFKCGYVLKD